MMQTIYPWQQSQWDAFIHKVQNYNLHHANLILGPKLTGKYQYAKNCASYLLNNANLENNPDFQEYSALNMEYLRELIAFINLGANITNPKVIIIQNFDNLNNNVYNGLLKILEEPPVGVIFFLIAEVKHKIPATILSRCIQLSFSSINYEQSLAYLQNNLAANDLQEILKYNFLLNYISPMLLISWYQEAYLTDNILCLFNPNDNNFGKLTLDIQKYFATAPLVQLDLLYYWLSFALKLKLEIIAEYSIADHNARYSYSWLNQATAQNLVKFLAFLQDNLKNLNQINGLNKNLCLENIVNNWVKLLG